MVCSVNFFTNGTKSQNTVLKQTMESFFATFGEMPFTIYNDPKPNLSKLRRKHIVTTSLSDGYIRSIHYGEADYLFQIEHDWTFQNIEHSAMEIIEQMKKDGLYFMRFNKRENGVAVWDRFLHEVEGEVPYCKTPNLSNNPHIIDRNYYLNHLMHRLQLLPGSKGIEEYLLGKKGNIYGKMGHPPTIIHLDGRKK